MHVRDKIDDEELVLIRCSCVPSMRSKVRDIIASRQQRTNTKKKKRRAYTVYLCFERKGGVLLFPYSLCSCPRGQCFCAHCLGLLLICKLIQDCTAGRTWFEKVMPISPLRIQFLPYLSENLARHEILNRSEGQRRRHQKQRTIQRQP